MQQDRLYGTLKLDKPSLAMFEENEALQQSTQGDISGIVKLAPVALALPLAIPFALPLALHAIHGIGVGALGVLVGSLAFNPKSQELIKSSGEQLAKMLPVDKIDPPAEDGE